jgi:hypothetical protein
MSDAHRIKSNPGCPSCKAVLSAATNVAGNGSGPSDGDFSVCVYCGQLLVFRVSPRGRVSIAKLEDEDLPQDGTREVLLHLRQEVLHRLRIKRLKSKAH